MLSHTSPLSKKNEPDSDKSPVGARTNQLTAKIDNSLSNSQNIDEILKRNQHASTSVSVTSKNITTANYLNQNNQYITSQPIPSQNAFITLNNANSPQKTTLEELEKKLFELEKATQDPKSIFAQNPLFTSTETLSLADQGRSPQKFGSHLQGTSEISQQYGQSYKRENAEKNKNSPGKHKQFDAAHQGGEGESNIERADLKNKATRSGQLQNEEEDLEGADTAKQYAIQKGIAIQSSSAQDLKNELKNNLSPSFGGQNARQHSQSSNSNNLAEVHEGNNLGTGSAEHQNIHYNQATSQHRGFGDQVEGQEDVQFHQRPGAAQFDQLPAQGSAEKAYKRSQIQNEQMDFSGPSTDQAGQGRSLEKNSQNKTVTDSLGFEKRQASFGNNSSHHETQVRTIDLQDLMPSHGLEDSRSRQDNINPFSSQQEGAYRSENQYGDDQAQGSSASKGNDLTRFKQEVSEFLVTKKENPSGKNEPGLNREPFQKSFENNLSVDQERKTEFSVDKKIHFGTNETEERDTSSGSKNPKSSLKKGASKNPKGKSEENEDEFSKESGESNQNLRPSLQSKKNAQYNSSEIEANNQRRAQKETSNEAVERKSNQKQQNVGKGLASEASQLKTPNKADKALRSDKKGTSNIPSQNQKTEENQAYSAGKVQKGINFGKQSAQSEKKNAMNRNEDEQQQKEEGLYDSNSLFSNQRGQNNRYSDKNDARRTDSSPETQSERAEQRLSKMNEEQAANLYEQRRNDIQKNMQRISKQKGTTKLADKKQSKAVQNPVASTVIPASEVRPQHQKLSGAESRLSSQVKQPEERSQIQQSQEAGGSKQKVVLRKDGQGGKIEASSQPDPKGRDSKNLWEKGSKTDTKQKRDYRQDEAKPDTVNRFGDAIQNARENILQRMENIERALDKDDSSSARSDKRTSYSAEKDKSKIRPRDIRTAEGQSTQDNRTPVGSGAKLKTPISAKTEISTATSPQDQQAVLASNKIQGFSGYAAMKTQAKNIQKERQSYQPETVETQYEAPRAVSNSGVKNNRNVQNNIREEKEKNAYSRPNATETVNAVKGETNADSKFKRTSYAVNADVRTPSKKGETPKLFSSENKTRITTNEFGNAQRDFSGSKQLARNLEGSKISHSEIPANSKYHEKRMKAQAEREESMLSNAVPGRNLERTNTNNTYSSEVPAHSKYHEKRMKVQMEREEQEQMVNQPQYKGQQKRKDKSLVQEEVDQRSPKRGNQTRENIKNRKEVSFSPRVQEYYSKPTGGDLSFEERNRLWVIKKNQNLAEKERMKYSQESIDCTFRPIIHQNENMKKLASDEFYQKNIEWSEKIRAENVLKGEMRLEEQQKPEPSKPRIRSNPTSPIVSLKPHGIFANKDLETIKKNLDFANLQSNKKLATYLEYDWNDDRLKKEIDDIEELYNYVKSLVKTRLEPNPSSPSKSFIADKPSSRPTIQQQNASPYSYKQKNPFGRTSLSAEKEVPRMTSLRNIVVNQNRDSHLASERASITKKPELEGTLHQEPGFNSLMDKSASTRLLIKDNRYVIVDDNAPEAANEQF